MAYPKKNAGQLGHAIRSMMDPISELIPAFTSIVEINENYMGGKPCEQECTVHIRARGIRKQGVLIAVERNRPVR